MVQVLNLEAHHALLFPQLEQDYLLVLHSDVYLLNSI